MKRIWLALALIAALVLPDPAWATLNEVAARNDYTASGTATAFSFTWKVETKADVEVLVDGLAKTVDADYTVSGLGASGGGTVTFLAAPAAGVRVTLLRKQPAKQQGHYQAGEAFPASRIEGNLDELAMQVQQDRETLRRAVRAPKRDSVDMVLPSTAARAGNILGFDSDGKPTVFAPATVPPSADASASTVLGSGSTTARSLAERWGEIVNVKDYGSDIAAAITAAVAKGGGDVILPPGTYEPNAMLSLPSGVCLHSGGAPAGGTPGIGIATIKPTAAVSIGIDSTVVKGACLRGLTVDMTNMAAGAVGIRMHASWQWSLDHVVVKQLPAALTASVSTASWAGGTITVTTTAAHGFTSGDYVLITGVTPAAYDYRGLITVTAADTFTLDKTSDPGTYSTGGTVTRHAIGIKLQADSAVTGDYFNRMSDIEVSNYSAKVGNGIGLVISGDPLKPVTSTVFSNIRQTAAYIGWILDNTASGMLCLDCGAESNTTDGMYVLNTSISAGAALKLLGGEIASNGLTAGGWGVTGDSTGRVSILGAVVANNGTGGHTDNIDTASLGSAILQLGATFTGASLRTDKTFIGGRGTQTVADGNTISSTTLVNRLTGSGGAVTMNNPTIAAGTESQMLILIGASDTSTVTIKDGGSGNVRLGGDCTLGLSDTLTLIYDAAAPAWTQTGPCQNN